MLHFLALLPLASRRTNMFIGTKAKRWFSKGCVVLFLPSQTKIYIYIFKKMKETYNVYKNVSFCSVAENFWQPNRKSYPLVIIYWATRANQIKLTPLSKEHWDLRGGSWNTPGLKTVAWERQSFPLGWRVLAEEWKRFSSRYFECQEKKNNPWINVDFEESDIA